ncbi:hypothetical protein EII22_08180 [Coriobacteriales bacterium OH1046]|nr:hypothetical protein EII22_08180 [Coriobacteriales bacterium OH1046]
MATMLDDGNFASLSPDRWEDLCMQILIKEGRNVTKVDGKGGDGGVDAYEGTYESPSVIYQFKYFRNGIKKSQIDQIRASLKKAHERFSSFKWVLMCSSDPSPAAAKKLEGLRDEYPGTEIVYMFRAIIIGKLTVYKSIRRFFYPDVLDAMHEALDSDGKGDYIESFSRKARLLNERCTDDRFYAQISSDGESSSVIYRLQPWVKGSVPIVNLKSKTARGSRAIKDLVERGMSLDLSGDDIEVETLVQLIGDEEGATVERVWTIPRPPTDENLMRIYSSPDPASSTGITVRISTERKGTRELVRSNSHQKDCPILLRLTVTDSPAQDGETTQTMTCQLTPRFYGCTTSSALRGARFLYEIAMSGSIGFACVDDDVSEGSFAKFNERIDVEAARSRLEFVQMVKDVVDFFGIDPILDESLEESSFERAFGFLRRAIRWNEGGEFDDDLSLDVLPAPNPDSTAGGAVGFNDGSIVSCDYYVEAFGYRMTARIIVETKDCQTKTELMASGGYRLTVSGRHKVSAAAMEAVRL